MESIRAARNLTNILILCFGSYLSWQCYFLEPYSAHRLTAAKPEGLAFIKPGHTLVAAGTHFTRSGFGRFWLGDHYRNLWATPVTAPLFKELNRHYKLQVNRKGGGMQTTSFTLLDASGKEYSLRSIDKDPVTVLPQFLWPTICTGFVRDQISGTDPYAFKPVGLLSQAAGIYQPEQTLCFVASDEHALKKYGTRSGGLYVFSAKKSELEALAESGEMFRGVLNTAQMLAEIRRQEFIYEIDTLLYLKCRIFDLYISDWDRHPRQWDWVAFTAGNKIIFKPLPEDRDQAFCNYEDGVIPWILTRKFAIRKFTAFKPEFEDMEGFGQNGSVLDNWLLKNVPEKAFSSVSGQLQAAFTDSVLRKAVNAYPEEVQPQISAKTYRVLKARRQNLHLAARNFHYAITHSQNENYLP